MTLPPFSLYVHVPFCERKCPYCDFNTYATPQAPEAEYSKALCAELSAFARDSRFAGRSLRTIFFGGGTPSMLSGQAIGAIIAEANRYFPILADAEVTLEANPGRVAVARLPDFRAAGVNRLSFGVQSFSDSTLQFLGRDHSALEARQAIESAVSAGISNVSLDLIFGVPGQSMSDLLEDLSCAVRLPIAHLSTYGLTIEPGTPLYQRQERGLLTMPPDSIVAEMLERVPAFLEPHGFLRYEISNYSKPSYESRHNQVYWSGGDYLGIGAGAHSYVAEYDGARFVSGSRWSTLAAPGAYMDAAQIGNAISWRESVAPASARFEFFYLGLRTTRGVSVSNYQTRFGESLWDAWGDTIHELIGEGFLENSGDALSLSPSGVLVADSVFERFVR